MHVYMYTNQRWLLGIFQYGSPPSPSLPGLRLQYAILPDFCVGAVDPNSGSHVCVAGTLPTEPHPQAQTHFFFYYPGVTSA